MSAKKISQNIFLIFEVLFNSSGLHTKKGKSSEEPPQNSHLILSGEPGTGKSQLLLVNAILMAERDDVDKVVFLIDESKQAFREWLQSEIERHSNLKKKHKIYGLDRQARYVLFDFKSIVQVSSS